MGIHNLNNIAVVDHGVLLTFKNKAQKAILFSEIQTISIQVNKTHATYVFLFIALCLCGVLFLLWELGFQLILFLPILLMILGVIKINDNKSYVLNIVLHNGNTIFHPISLKIKNKTVDVLFIIRNELTKRNYATSTLV